MNEYEDLKNYGTLQQVKLKVTVLGDPNVGKKTFLKALNADSDYDDESHGDVVNVYGRDIKNDCMVVLQCAKFDDPREAISWLS